MTTIEKATPKHIVDYARKTVYPYVQSYIEEEGYKAWRAFWPDDNEDGFLDYEGAVEHTEELSREWIDRQHDSDVWTLDTKYL